MGYGYQKRDYEIVDYQLWQMDGIQHPFRGPKPASLEKNEYFACLGAAQTFGCFCEKPFPTLLSEKLSFDVLNIGHAGAGPLFFIKRKKYIQLVNNARFAVIQVMSGRSEGNSVFESLHGRRQIIRKNDGKLMIADKAYKELIETTDEKRIKEIIDETRENYVNHFIELLEAIKVPKILFWFSERPPDYIEEFTDYKTLFGKYPQFVNREMIAKLKLFADYYIESISSEGLPQPLFNRFTGNRVGFKGNDNTDAKAEMFNTYYPSPQMHEHAFSSLVQLCSNLIGNGRRKLLFIGGCGRSGTTVLTEIVGAHHQIVLSIERFNKLMRKNFFRLTTAHFTKEHFTTIYPGDTFYDDFHKFKVHENTAEKFEQAVYIGLKYPPFDRIYQLMRANFGTFKYLYIYRSIFDVAESWNRRAEKGGNWPKEKNYLKAVQRWNDSLGNTLMELRNGVDIICINYDDLLFTEKSIQPIFDRLGIPIDENVSKTLANARKLAPTKKSAKGSLLESEIEYIRENARFDLYDEIHSKFNILR